MADVDVVIVGAGAAGLGAAKVCRAAGLNFKVLDTTEITFVNCKSKEWNKIGELLAALPALSAISVEDCDSGDELCAGVSSSKSVVSIMFGNFEVTQNVAECRTRESRS